jgi:hypothetical protein
MFSATQSLSQHLPCMFVVDSFDHLASSEMARAREEMMMNGSVRAAPQVNSLNSVCLHYSNWV